MASSSGKPVCSNFAPNVWRPTLCRVCYCGLSEHEVARQAGIKPQRWQYAVVEGGDVGFSSEQMHHWVSAGHLNPTKLLVRRVPEGSSAEASEFALVGKLFADPATAFVPDGMDAEAWGDLARSLAGKGSAAEAVRNGSASSAKRTLDSKAEVESAPIVPAAFSKSEIARVAAAMQGYFANGTSWYYYDSEGEQHGPFSGKKMGEWFQAGFLWQTQLQVGHEGWDSFSALEDLVAAATGEAAPADAASSSGGAGGSGTDVDVRLGAADAASSSTEGGVAEAAPADALDSGAAVTLEYVDDDGVVQGPFDHAVVSRWVLDGMFPLDLLMRVAGDAGGQWQPAGELAVLADAVAAHEVAAAAAAAAASDGAAGAGGARGVGSTDGGSAADERLRVESIEEDSLAGATDGRQPGATVAPTSMVEYIDDAGEVQGPFEAALVQSWLQAGYFEHGAKARLGGTSSWVAMSDLFAF